MNIRRGTGLGWRFVVIFFSVGVHFGLAQELVVSELMYNPLPDAGETVDADEYEFLELYNNGTVTADLGGSYFDDGISFTFPGGSTLSPGGRLVLVRNGETFSNRYAAVTNVVGVYDGKLSNGGEKLTLNKATHLPWFSFDYSDGAQWPAAADGLGASLVLKAYDADMNDPSSWGRSDRLHGTPGVSGECARVDVVINEVLAHTDHPQEDAIELFNVSSGAVELTGWYLSDAANSRKKYRIPITTLAPGEYALFLESDFNDTNNTENIPFALSELGDSVFLTAADAQSNLTRFVAFQEFGVSENGVSQGLFPNGAGSWVTLAEPTLGASNSTPSVGPIVISEIMYHPASDDDALEYIELLNISSNIVSLYDEAHPTNTWRLSEAFDDFYFPTGITMQAGERILAVGTDDEASFRAAYDLVPEPVVIGSWTGKLSNGGETVELYKPASPESNEVPYILVDRVAYGDGDPWPKGPDGYGPSLERINADVYGDDANNWLSGVPGGTPGAAPEGGLFNPLIIPAVPLDGASFTVTVSVVSETVPTQVVLQVESQGGATAYTMRDDGVLPDAVAGDMVYSAAVAGQPAGTWVYYRFRAAYTNMTLELPRAYAGTMNAPEVSVRMSWSGLYTTAMPIDDWMTITNYGIATHSNRFYVFLEDSGEAWVDDLSFVDLETGTEHVGDGGFSNALTGVWELDGNHSDSFREIVEDESSNAVLHVVAHGPGDQGGTDRIAGTFAVPVTNDTPLRLTFRIRRARQLNADWLWVVVGGDPSPDVVMNEIMYHPNPLTGEERDAEYVELYNPGSVDLCLSNWVLEGVGNLKFADDAVLGAGQYLVCCANQTNIQAIYGITNIVGNWAGQLQNDGETLRLKNQYGRILDEVAYEDGKPWPSAPDGYGPSLERINPGKSGNTAENWAVSCAATNWQYIVWTQRVNSSSGQLYLWLDYGGKCRLDDVSVQLASGGPELITNGTFESGTGGWELMGNHERSRIEPNSGRTGTQALVIASATVRTITSDGAVVSYGDGYTNALRSHTFSTSYGENYRVSFWVLRESAGHNINGRLLRTAVPEVDPVDRAGTPGASNSCGQTETEMTISDVQQQYNVCATGVANVVRAQIEGRDAVADVSLFYRAFGTNGYEYTDFHYTQLAMLDDGVAPDPVADDGEYTAEMPVIDVNRTFVRYHVTATATNGIRRRAPSRDDPDRDFAYWVESDPLQTHLPNWHLLTDGGPMYYPVGAWACAVSPDGQIFVDVLVRQRGNSNSYVDKLRTGLALRVHRGRPLRTWFGAVSRGINFRTRRNDVAWFYRRFVHEYIAYELQRVLGLPTPRIRHACLWVNGEPSITLELEAPDESFAKDFDIPGSDLLMRGGWSGLRVVSGDESLNNVVLMITNVDSAVGASITETVHTNLNLETLKYSLGLLAACANGDQHFLFNMFQHRSGKDGRWTQYPWDVDNSFSLDHELGYTLYMPELHPYYQTALHPNMWVGGNFSLQVTKRLFYPESGGDSIYTLPYRYRQQRTLWRLYHTLFTTNYLYPRFEEVFKRLEPAFVQVGAPTNHLRDRVDEGKDFLTIRRNYLFNQSWSDKMSEVWDDAAYTTTNIVINEIMYRSDGFGGEFLELYNRGTQTVDLGWWTLTCGDETYHLPHGTMMGPTSMLVIADTHADMTNAYYELSDAAGLVRRYDYSPVWDRPVDWLTASEYSTRLVQIPGLTLPNNGAVIQLYDWTSNLIDAVSYSNVAPWPDGIGVSLELIDPASDNSLGVAWRANQFVGTPGEVNAAARDMDGDEMDDLWEMRIVDASAGAFFDVYEVIADDDFDGDGLNNIGEFTAGTDPTVADYELTDLGVALAGPDLQVHISTIAPTGSVYDLYSARSYTLQRTDFWWPYLWSNVSGAVSISGSGTEVIYTNSFINQVNGFRSVIELVPVR